MLRDAKPAAGTAPYRAAGHAGKTEFGEIG